MESVFLVNGERGSVDLRDRGLAYGDGVFETMACHGGRVRWIEQHLDRLILGCARLAIPPPDREQLRSEIEAACPADASAVVKLIVTRGVGERGYPAPPSPVPTRILSIAPWLEPPAEHYTAGVKLKTCALRLGENPQLAGLKHLCRLEQVLAQMELTGSDADEGLLRSSRGLVISGITSNVFAVRGNQLLTPLLDRCGVRGVVRRVALEHAPQVGLAPVEADLEPEALLDADELFISNAAFGIKPVARLDDRAFPAGEKTRALMRLLGYGPDA